MDWVSIIDAADNFGLIKSIFNTIVQVGKEDMVSGQ